MFDNPIQQPQILVDQAESVAKNHRFLAFEGKLLCSFLSFSPQRGRGFDFF